MMGARAVLGFVVHRLEPLDEGPNLLHRAQALGLQCHAHPPSVEDSTPLRAHSALDSARMTNPVPPVV